MLLWASTASSQRQHRPETSLLPRWTQIIYTQALVRFEVYIPLLDGANAQYNLRETLFNLSVFNSLFTFKASSTLCRINLKTQLYCYGYTFRPHYYASIRIERSTKTELFENAFQSGTIWKRYFFVLVWTENFLYPQLFVYAHVILSCNLFSQVLQHGEEYDIFCVLDNIYLL